MNALKPCPFCGGEATENRDISNSIYCKKCFAEIDTDCVDWNIRPIEDAIRKRIAELEALVNVSEGLYERIYEQAARIAELENELEGKRVFTDTLFYDIYRLQSRIAEFEARAEKAEAMVEKLIEAGRMMKQPETIEEFHRGRRDYNALVAEFEAEIDQLTADSTDERKDDKLPEREVCEACGGDGTLLLTDGYEGQVMATVKCIYCNGTGRVNKECEE